MDIYRTIVLFLFKSIFQMKILFAAALLLVGSCATLRHSEKIENLKESIAYDNEAVVNKYLSNIKSNELQIHVEEIASPKYNGSFKKRTTYTQ